jgi:hypothetical protein
MCRALLVLCVAPDAAALEELKRATTSAEWELAPGATGEREALDRIDAERPHVLVAFGPFERLVGLVAERFPGMRIVADRDAPGVAAVAPSLEVVRGLVIGDERPGGPVRSPAISPPREPSPPGAPSAS